MTLAGTLSPLRAGTATAEDLQQLFQGAVQGSWNNLLGLDADGQVSR